MGEIIAVVNQKGGVAKTTSTLNLGACMAEVGKKVLLVDLDSQANLTQSIRIKKENQKSVYNVLLKTVSVEEAICNTEYNGLDIIKSTMDLANADGALVDVKDKELLLKDALNNIKAKYDYVLIDCCPALNVLTVNALVAADSLLIPMEPGIFALEGLAQLINIIKLITKKFNGKLKIKGVLLTRADSRSSVPQAFRDQLREIFGGKLFDTIIHQNVSITRSQMAKKPINVYDKLSRAYREYSDLTQEVLKRG